MSATRTRSVEGKLWHVLAELEQTHGGIEALYLTDHSRIPGDAIHQAAPLAYNRSYWEVTRDGEHVGMIVTKAVDGE